MGKKSRKKRHKSKRRVKSKTIESLMERLRNGGHSDGNFEVDFQNMRTQLRQLFSGYAAEDVAAALSVSDLWLPNISSLVKHHIAFGIFVSMSADEFKQLNDLKSYETFCDFIDKLYSLLLEFPMLEDYIPETDWGDVKVSANNEYLNIFYGGSVERIPDFIEAFRLKYRALPAALKDMAAALLLQNHLISNVDSDVVGDPSGIKTGHIEKPSEIFWSQCLKALYSMEDVLSDSKISISSSLILELGQFQQPSSYSSFGDALMNGKALPAVMMRINGKLFPILLRNVANVIIDYWSQKTVPDSKMHEISVSMSVAYFLSHRFKLGSVVGGPLKLMTQQCRLPYSFSAIVRDKKFHFIIVLDVEQLKSLKTLEKNVYDLLKSGVEWGVWNEINQNGMSFRNNHGKQPSSAEISLLVVLPVVSTSNYSISIPKDTNSRVMSLPDFVTIFDSLENMDELDKFWDYVDTNESMLSGIGFCGLSDLFGSFRDSNALLVDGAIMPNMISLDPHWGSNWRHKSLVEFWAGAPLQFPSDARVPDNAYSWNIESKSDGLYCLTSKISPTIAWGSDVSTCTVYFLLHVLGEAIDPNNGNILELFVHCISDSLSTRRDLLESLPLFDRKIIVVTCEVNANTLMIELEDEDIENKVSKPLFSDWQLTSDTKTSSLQVTVNINTARVSRSLESAKDASFEVGCVIDGIKGLSKLIGESISSDLVSSILATSSRKPRFTTKMVERKVDVPDYATADIPTLEQYKVARKELAVILKNQGGETGRYELEQAKAIIDPARDAIREKIHELISAFDKKSLLVRCIEQHDALSAEYKRKSFRVKMSLEHEVNYDRSESIRETHEEFIQNSRNYRYLIECCLSEKQSGKASVSTSDIIQLIAHIDWLSVLYGASDVLHNDIEVVGLEIDHSYIPHVFYSEKREKEFSIEMADIKLGLNLEQDDEVNSDQEVMDNWEELDLAFFEYLGFTLTQYTQMLWILAQWKSANNESELRLSYQSPKAAIVDILVSNIENLTNDGANSLIEFSTLDPAEIRRLLGRSIDESDVPVWEHAKRGSRYTIRPLILLEDNLYVWGADACDRAASIWFNSVSNGYLPADFDWPKVKEVVRKIKVSIELKLEKRAFEVCSRASLLVRHGIDFKRKFPKEGFDDAGDFDVLVYFPEMNIWLNVECKYNQPPFCIKDARRLRDRIFGSGSNRSQISKIERRHQFILSNANRLRALLGWSEPKHDAEIKVIDVYISRDIYWWLRNPPYDVSTQFIRIDALDHWLRGQGLLS